MKNVSHTCARMYVAEQIIGRSFKERTNGQLIIHWKGTVGIIVNALMMVFTFALMVYCGMMILCTLRKVAMCAKTKALQRQLMRALIFQVSQSFNLRSNLTGDL